MQIAVRQLANAQGNVDALLHQADRAVQQQGVNADLGELVQVIHQQRRDEQLTEQHWRGNRQLPTGLDMAAGRRILGFLQIAQDPPTVLEKTLAGLAQVHIAGGAHQQWRADPLLQRRHRPRHAGRRQPQAPRRRRKPRCLGHGKENLHFLEPVHPSPMRNPDTSFLRVSKQRYAAIVEAWASEPQRSAARHRDIGSARGEYP